MGRGKRGERGGGERKRRGRITASASCDDLPVDSKAFFFFFVRNENVSCNATRRKQTNKHLGRGSGIDIEEGNMELRNIHFFIEKEKENGI